MKDAHIPIYLMTGFLDSGKTSLLLDTLEMDYFCDGQRTVLLRCEDGQREYDPAFLSRRNVRLISLQDKEELTAAFLDEVDRRYQPQRVLVEYNGMWPLDRLRELELPDGWGLFQVISTICGQTFELYRSNMQSMIVDMVTQADLVLFNRCTADMPLASWKRAIRAVNRAAQIIFDANGEELEVEDILPYDLTTDILTLEHADYGIWYLDIQEHPEKYVGKTVHFTAQALPAPKLPKGQFIPGRNVMTCCEEDIRFFGFLCKYDRARQLKKGQWITVTAKIAFEDVPVYSGEGIVLYALSVQPAQRPEEPLVYF